MEAHCHVQAECQAAHIPEILRGMAVATRHFYEPHANGIL
jgi:hypothetical protein